MRVLITATSLRTAYGGPAFSVSQLAAALAARGVETALWAADGSSPGAELLPVASRIERLAGKLDATAAFGPDLIHDNGLWLPHNHRVAMLAREIGAPRLVSTRGMLEPWAIRHKGLKKKLAWGLYQRRDLARASALHTTAEAEAGNLQAFGLGVPVVTIANGVDLPDIIAAPPPRRDGQTRTALFLGRLYPVKGLPMLIEAWSKVRPPGWRLVIAGPDEAGHQAVLEAAVAAAGLGEVVAFTGAVEGEAKASLLRDADFLVLPSHSESFGMVVAEGLAHGTPVLTTTATPWPALEQRRCGWRAQPTPGAIAEALHEATNCALRRACGRWARRDARTSPRRWGWDGIAAEFIALYERLVRAHDRATAPSEAAA